MFWSPCVFLFLFCFLAWWFDLSSGHCFKVRSGPACPNLSQLRSGEGAAPQRRRRNIWRNRPLVFSCKLGALAWWRHVKAAAAEIREDWRWILGSSGLLVLLVEVLPAWKDALHDQISPDQISWSKLMRPKQPVCDKAMTLYSLRGLVSFFLSLFSFSFFLCWHIFF